MVLLKEARAETRREKSIRCLILGLDNAGKSSIVAKFFDDDPDDVSPTMGFQIRSQKIGPVVIDFWDIGGQQSLRSFWSHYFHAANALIWVVDSLDKDRLSICRQELHSVLQDERLSTVSLLILANKQDLQGALTSEDVQKLLGIEHGSGVSRKLVCPCSALEASATELRRVFIHLFNECRERLYPETRKIDLDDLADSRQESSPRSKRAKAPPAADILHWDKIPTYDSEFNIRAATREKLFTLREKNSALVELEGLLRG